MNINKDLEEFVDRVDAEEVMDWDSEIEPNLKKMGFKVKTTGSTKQFAYPGRHVVTHKRESRTFLVRQIKFYFIEDWEIVTSPLSKETIGVG